MNGKVAPILGAGTRRGGGAPVPLLDRLWSVRLCHTLAEQPRRAGESIAF
jgi:hypothetical protein